jgi:NADH-quinone oxidoreductase subunit I
MTNERPDVPREQPDDEDEHPAAYPRQERPSLLHDMTGLASGLRTSIQESLRKPVTTQYPEDKTPRSERYRGRHYLRRYENDLERCIGCQLCSAACPVGCILVIAAENTVEHRVSPGERYAKVYEINMLRCIFCGYCEEACPVQAIVLGPEYELSDVSRERFVYTKDMLLEPPVAGGRADAAQDPGQQEPLRIG